MSTSIDAQRIAEEVRAAIQRSVAAMNFALRVREDQIVHEYGAWTIPVASGVSGGSGYELTRTLTSLQEAVEERVHTPVTILLDIE